MPQLATITVGQAALAGVGVAAFGMNQSAKRQRRMTTQANQVAAQQLAFQKEQQEKLDKQKDIYRKFEFTNPYENMENVFEDLTVNQQTAQFQAQQGAQQRADILARLRESAGGSGVSSLAAELSRQQQLQTQQISADLSRQESSLQRLKAQGASAADMAERGGEAMVQEAEASRQATLLGVEYGGMAGANAALQQAYGNQMQANAMATQMTQDRFNTMATLISGMGQG